MTAPRLEIDHSKLVENTRTLVDRLAPLGIRVTGVTKAALGSPAIAAAMVRGGAQGLGDSRVANLERVRTGGFDVPHTLIRSPIRSQADAVVAAADRSLNTEPAVLDALSAVAVRAGRRHEVVLMVELGDLREGVLPANVVGLAQTVARRRGLVLVGLGTNLACQCGVVPDQTNMDQLSSLVEQVESACGTELLVVSGGNSANLDWATSTTDVGRINELRLGEAILLGTEPLHRRPIDGLHTDAFRLVAEVIEVGTKPAQPWGTIAQTAFGAQPARRREGTLRQAIVALGRQDVDPDDVVAPLGTTVLGASSDHLVLALEGDSEAGDARDVAVGDELTFALGYSALVRAMTSPFVSRS